MAMGERSKHLVAATPFRYSTSLVGLRRAAWAMLAVAVASTAAATDAATGTGQAAPVEQTPGAGPTEQLTPSGGPTPAPAASPAPAPITAPQDPRLAKVYAVFDAACAQCHQTGRLTRPAPAGGLADILDLATLVREPHLVRPGVPDASKIYQVLLDRHRPVELGADIAWPSAEDIQRIRTWIEEAPVARTGCPEGPVTDGDVAKAITAAVHAVGEAEGRDLRFITLGHLANACATRAEMEGYRQGIAKLLNSLSWGSRPIIPTPVDAGGTVLAVKLADIGWIDEHWKALAAAEPRGIALDLTGRVTAPGASTRPIRGDWLAWAASQPPFYGELLGLPPTADDAARLLGIKRDGDAAQLRGTRAAIASSAITRGPRVFEVHHAENRALWLAYDFIDGLGDRDAFERPLGGVHGAPELAQFHADSQRMMTTLPNGFLAFAIAAADGHRIDQLPPRLDLETARALPTSAAGLSCLSCHSAGPKPFADSLRAHVTSDKFIGAREVREQTLTLTRPPNEWLTLFDEDGFRYRRALIQAGIDPDLTIHGLEQLGALAQRYILPVDFVTAAAELGINPAELEAKLANVSLDDRTLAPRLRQGSLSREEVNGLLSAVRMTPATPPPAVVATPVPAETGVKLSLWTDRPGYKVGDLMTIYAQASAPCHLTVISVAASGKATVLFPNEIEPENLIAPAMPISVPTSAAPYQFRFKEAGAETVIGTCQTVAQFLPGIAPDYERQRFTVLGNYVNFVGASFGLDTDAQRTAARLAAEKPAPLHGSRTQARDARAEPPKNDAGKNETKPEQIARAAVRVEIGPP